MTSSLFLRVASGVSLVFAAGHLAGGVKQWSPMGPNPVLSTMAGVRFQTMGVSRSYADFFMGFGWSVGIAMMLQAVLLWQIADMARERPVQTRPMIVAFAVATLATGIVAWRLIFPIPALFSGVVLAALVAAYIASGRAKAKSVQ